MILFDVNILIYAMREDRPEHQAAKVFLQQHLEGHRSVGWHPILGSALVRITTHPKVPSPPSKPRECFEFLADLLSFPMVMPIFEGPGFWPIFENLVLRYDLRGNDITDAYLAALAIDNGALLISSDVGFLNYKELDFQLTRF